MFPKARTDLGDVAYYYSSRRRGLGRRFLAAAGRTFQRLRVSGEIHARYEFETASLADARVCNLDEFDSYVVIYRMTNSAVEIVRVVHGARHIDSMTTEELLGDDD